jgi:hypothetical protein
MACIEISVLDGTNMEEMCALLIREWRRRGGDEPAPEPRPDPRPAGGRKKKPLFDFLRRNKAKDAPVEEPPGPVRPPRGPPERIRRQTLPAARRAVEQQPDPTEPVKSEKPVVEPPRSTAKAVEPLKKERPLTLELRLSAAGLNQPLDFECESFRFVVNGKSYVCPRFQAMFVSRAVSHLVTMDRTVDEYIVENVSHPESFEMIMRLMSGGSVMVNDDNCAALFEIAKSLQNLELESRLLEFRPDCDSLNEANAINRLLEAARRSESIEREIDFIALHFCEVKNIERLSLDILERILENDHLTIESEDWLLCFVIEQMNGCQSLLRHIWCEYLSSEAIEIYTDQVDLDDVDRLTFRSIFCRLVGQTTMAAVETAGSKAAVSSGGLGPEVKPIDQSTLG